MRAAVALVLVPLLSAGCARALHPSGDLARATDAAAASPGAPAASLMRSAEAMYERRDPASVRRAAELWLAAARDEALAPAALAGATRAWIWLADRETDADSRVDLAEAAVISAQRCRELAGEDPSCLYWLAAALGVQARERRATAFDALPRIVELLEQAIERRPDLEHGGPHRVLALVLLRAPGWPIGPGDPDRGLDEARRAVGIDPEYPPNQLCLAEALAANGEAGESLEAYRKAESLALQRVAAGDAEAGGWLDEARRACGR